MALRISIQSGELAVCRLAPDAPAPSWPSGPFVSITRTTEELSIVCAAESVPPDVRAERGWRFLKVEGPIPFEMTGIAAALVSPLAAEKIPVFLLATFDTDYLLLKSDVFDRAVGVLRACGHELA